MDNRATENKRTLSTSDASLGKHFEVIYLQIFNYLANLLRCIRCVKNMVAGHTKTNIANRETDCTGADLLSIGMTMKITTFGSHVTQCFWFWDIIQLLHESNVKQTFIRINGLVSNMCTLEIISISFNYYTHRKIICSTSSCYSSIVIVT